MFISFVVALILSKINSFYCLVNAIKQLSGMTVFVAAFLGTGAIGFLFANIYYQFREISFLKAFNNHGSILKEIEKDFGVSIYLIGNPEGGVEGLCVRQKWELFNYIWHTTKNQSKSMQDIEAIATRMHNVAHALGTTFVGSVILFTITLFYLPDKSTDSSLFYHYLICWFLLMVLIGNGYYKLNKSVCKLYDEALFSFYNNEFISYKFKRFRYDPR